MRVLLESLLGGRQPDELEQFERPVVRSRA